MSILLPDTPARREARALALLIGPILLSQLSQAAYGVLDTIMAGQVSPLDLAGVAMGSSVWLPLLLLISGTLMATTPLVAEAWGAGKRESIPPIVHQALWLGLLIGLGGFLLLRHIEPLFGVLGMPANLYDITQRYLLGISWGMPAVAFFAVLRCYGEGLGRPAPVMMISVLGLPLNALFNYLFIYGKLGLPAMGGAGCGWATGITLWCMVLMLLAYLLRAPFFAPVRLLHERSRPEAAALLRFLRLGLPIGIAVFFEVSVFCVVAILISPLGERVVAGHQIAFSVTSLFFMLPLSLALALTIRIGHAYGRRDLAAIRLTRRTGLRLTTVLSVITAAIIVIFRHAITALYTQDAGVRALATELLLFAAAYQVFDALQVAAAGCLRGLQDTRGPMVLTLLAYWVVAVPVGYSLGLTLLFGHKLGPHGLWTGLVAGLFAACVLLNWRLRQQLGQLAGRWAA
jgi:MATE family multidrug resistance protein